MKINKESGTVISLDRAVELTYSYQEQNPTKPNSYFIGIDRLGELLKQSDCIGLRIYPGFDTKSNQDNMVLVAVDHNQEDLTGGIMLDELVICPPYCPKKSKLVKSK